MQLFIFEVFIDFYIVGFYFVTLSIDMIKYCSFLNVKSKSSDKYLMIIAKIANTPKNPKDMNNVVVVQPSIGDPEI